MAEDLSARPASPGAPREVLEGEPNASGRAYGEIIAVGTRPAGGGRIALAEAPRPGEPTLRWVSHARTIDEIEQELARIWAEPNLMVDDDGLPGATGTIAARTSVMNLVVVARSPRLGERAAEIISRLTGRHPSRTLIVLSADPDGPPWLDARIQAHCVLPRADAPETCTELIYLTAGGETGRHLSALVAPLLIHDLPGHRLVAGRAAARRSAPTAELLEDHRPAGRRRLGLVGRRPGPRSASSPDSTTTTSASSIRDFALVRQSRWREAIASIFDLPEFLPYLAHVRRIAVTYGTHDETGAPGTHERRQAAVPRRLAGLAAGHAGRVAADAGRARRARRAAPGRAAPARRAGAAPPRPAGTPQGPHGRGARW